MKKIILLTGVGCGALALSACQGMPVAAPLPQVVAGYCALPVTDRLVNRVVIDSLIVPNTVAITCAADKVLGA